MAQYDAIFKNGTIVNQDGTHLADIGVRGGLIAALGSLGAATADVCRRHGISSATFYNWKAKFGGMDISDAKRLKALEDENAKLKKLLAETMLDNAILKDVASKKW